MNRIMIDGYVNYCKYHKGFITFSLSHTLNKEKKKKVYIDCLVSDKYKVEDGDYCIIEGIIDMSIWETENGKNKKHYIKVITMRTLKANKPVNDF